MTSTTTDAPPPGDADDGRAPLPQPRGEHRWEPLAPGALGADSTSAPGPDALIDAVPPLPLTGPLADSLTAARTGLDEARASSLYTASLKPHQRLQALRQVAQARHVADAVLLRLASTFTAEEIRTLGSTTLVDLLLNHTGADDKRAGLEAKLALVLTAPPIAPPPAPAEEPTLDDLGDDDGSDGPQPPAPTPPSPGAGSSTVTLGALGLQHAAGAVSTDVAGLAQRTVSSLPAKIRRAHGAVADAALAAVLPGLTHAQARVVCETVACTLDPDRADGTFDPDDLERRYLNVVVHPDGWVDLHGRFDPVVGAAIKAAIDHLSKPEPTVHAPLSTDHADAGTGTGTGTEQTSVPVRDERTAPQRRADALGVLVRQGLTNTETRGGEPPRVIVNATEGQVRGDAGAGQATCETTGRPLTRAALLHLACSGVIQAVTMSCDGADAAVLSLGRAVRLFTASQRRAMLARDGGCLIPGCTAPPGWLEAHHVHDWAQGGPTDVDNGVLVCTRHHLLVTLGVWQIRIIDGVPQVRAPRSIDPLRRWLLNPRRALRDRTARRAEQLLLLGDPPAGRREEPPDPPDEQAPTAPDIPSPHSTCAC